MHHVTSGDRHVVTERRQTARVVLRNPGVPGSELPSCWTAYKLLGSAFYAYTSLSAYVGECEKVNLSRSIGILPFFASGTNITFQIGFANVYCKTSEDHVNLLLIPFTQGMLFLVYGRYGILIWYLDIWYLSTRPSRLALHKTLELNSPAQK